MPELAEVEYFRRQWDCGLGEPVTEVLLRNGKRPLRGLNRREVSVWLTGALLESSEARGKQMLFRFSGDLWLGIHLGMTGHLRVAPADARAGRHDHFRLRQSTRTLVFEDPRGFGRIRVHRGTEAPEWWSRLPDPPHKASFTLAHLITILHRHARSPLKALLLRQDRFAGIGNWMADEILWRAGLHPRMRPSALSAAQTQSLWRATRFVCRGALRIVAKDYSDPPPSWLFRHRWEKGGKCPQDGAVLRRGTVGGRTTAWCPRCQPQKTGI